MNNTRDAYLDFLRAFAIISVLLAHIVLAIGAPNVLAPLQFGGSGVTLFFVLSGWLLGNQLFQEYKNNSKINVRKFLIKRWIRTLPPYLIVLLLTITQLYLSNKLSEFPYHYFIFTQNYTNMTFFTVSWSLAVEEQFYLFIAPLIVFLFKLKILHRNLILALLLLLPSIFRFFGFYDNSYQTHVVFDSCLIGVIAAYINQYYCNFIKHVQDNYGYYLSLSIFLYLSVYFTRYGFFDFYTQPDNLFISLVFVFILVSMSNLKWSFYNIYLFKYIALRSYGIYLVHPDAIAISKRISQGNSILIVIFSILISLFLAELMYKLIEKPISQNRDQIINFCSKFDPKAFLNMRKIKQ